MTIDILNPRLGLQDVLAPVGDELHLPAARSLASNVVGDTGLAQHFNFEGSAQIIERALTPLLHDERLLRPDIFKGNLRRSFESLKSSRRPEVRRFVREDLAPMMEDDELYAVYEGLLLDG
jgi:type III secretion protein X